MRKIQRLILLIFLTTMGLSPSVSAQKTPDAVECGKNFINNQVSTGKVTAWDLWGVARYKENEDFSFLNEWQTSNSTDPAWQEKVKALSTKFRYMPDIYSDEDTFFWAFAPGDLIIYQIPVEKYGGVATVTGFNDDDDYIVKAYVYENTKAKPYDNPNFQLSLYPKSANKRFIRAGLSFLRITDTKLCTQDSRIQSPAAVSNSASWVAMSEGQSLPAGAVVGGEENGFGNFYVCRVPYNNGYHPGKLISGNGKCYIGWGGKELIFSNYEVLTAKGHWGKEGSANAFVGGTGDGFTLYVCRVNYGNRGTHLGKVVGNQCNFGYYGKEMSSQNFEYFYLDSR